MKFFNIFLVKNLQVLLILYNFALSSDEGSKKTKTKTNKKN